MCGIFGYIGKKNNAATLVLDGLKLLEYRGYDSWGVAVHYDKKVVIEKHVGKIGNASVTLPKSSIGIGHTRWATHGGVTEKNAHPHLDCKEELANPNNVLCSLYQVASTTRAYALPRKSHKGIAIVIPVAAACVNSSINKQSA